ncbi:2OG-Fe(II) oxygenase family protein [Massilia sp. BJB1822]|uniref:2OG-Fe(II) oxygenase family protein n=1 Tax=Massilia sp. BJB1822 TaxID=2744470 RepID=UPI0015942C28|nr:2OG-Fe(II) oxygenase family protein [Massilia sp. BJB1822]NVD97982.1 2OG-Fe(II) oxygenase [Massilia sp. BJB1822]
MKLLTAAQLDATLEHTRQIGVSNIDYDKCSQELIDHGYSILTIPVHLQKDFWKTVELYPTISGTSKHEFAYPDRTDGFMPFGMEYANSTNNVDLCERFCYRDKYRSDHRQHPFADHQFYRHIVDFESGISAIAERVLENIMLKFSIAEPLETRSSSYLQFCAYNKEYRKEDREYLQDRHEDGHLITFVKATRDGLVIFPNGEQQRVTLADDEIIVFTGSLLTEMSDGKIPYMDHAVLNPAVQVERSSLVYFVIPELKRKYTSFIERRDLDLEKIANENHESFGNIPFTVTAEA